MKLVHAMSALTIAGIATFAIASSAVAGDGATVLNWGHDEATCSAFCGPDLECVVDGKLTLVETPSGNAALTCTDATWVLEPPEEAQRGDVDCGYYGTGQFVITPSAQVNFSCHN